MERDFANKFYGSPEWKTTRELYRKTVGGLCEICEANGLIVPGEIVHHKVHLNKFNIDDPKITLDFSNLMLVCRDCHARLHSSDPDSATGRRYIIGEDGSVIILDNKK